MGRSSFFEFTLLRLAMRMLLGDAPRAAMIGFGVLLASALMMQQMGLFTGLIERSQNAVADAAGVDVWVMHPTTKQFNLAAPIAESAAARIAGMEGVAAAAPFAKASLAVSGPEGRALSAQLFALDDARLLGGPRRWLLGGPAALRGPDAVAIDRIGFMKLWPGEPVALGKTFELGGRRAVVAAVTEAAPVFGAEVLLHARRSLAARYAPAIRPGEASYVLARLAPGAEAEAVARRIEARTGLTALSSEAFSEATKSHYLRHTGIAKNFLTTILLGVVAGVAIVGLTFSLFIADNMPHYAVLKTVGLSGGRLALLALAQIAALTLVGFGLGAAIAYGFFAGVAGPDSALRGFRLEPWIVAASFATVALSVLSSASLGLWRVGRADPALVFREAA